MISISGGLNWHSDSHCYCITFLGRKKPLYKKFQVVVFQTCSLTFFSCGVFFLGLYSVIYSSTCMFFHLSPVFPFWIFFKHLNLVACLWWLIRFLTDVDRARRKCRCISVNAGDLTLAESAFGCCVCVIGHIKGQHIPWQCKCWPEGVGH